MEEKMVNNYKVIQKFLIISFIYCSDMIQPVTVPSSSAYPRDIILLLHVLILFLVELISELFSVPLSACFLLTGALDPQPCAMRIPGAFYLFPILSTVLTSIVTAETIDDSMTTIWRKTARTNSESE